MKILLALLISVGFAGSCFAAPSSAKGRRLTEINAIPQKVLRRSISPEFYKTLTISPLEGWITARAHLSGTKIFGERVTRSDMDGAFDKVALQVLRDIKIQGDYKLDSQIKTSRVLMHLLVYKIADGTLALYFATLDGAGSDQDDYFGCAKLAVLKGDGSWTEIIGPAGLHGKGIAVRSSGLRSKSALSLLLEKRPSGANFQ